MMFNVSPSGVVPYRGSPVVNYVQPSNTVWAEGQLFAGDGAKGADGLERQEAVRLLRQVAQSSKLSLVSPMGSDGLSPPRKKKEEGLLIAPWLKVNFLLESPTSYAFLGRQDERRARWVKGRLLGRGSFAKVYLGMNVRDRSPVAIKVLASHVRRPAKLWGKQFVNREIKTFGQSDRQIVTMLQRTIEFRGWIDRALAEVMLRHKGRDPLLGLRAAVTAYHVFDIGTFEGKYFAVTSLEQGDLGSLAKLLLPQQRSLVALSAALQIFFELSILHTKKFAHCDIKLENMLFNKDGQIKLLDYDVVRPITNKGHELDRSGARGGLRVPEMFALNVDGLTTRTLTAKIDIYATSASLLQILAPFAPCPFTFIRSDRRFKLNDLRAPDFLANQKVLKELDSYREKVLRKVHLTAESLRCGTKFDDFFVEAYKNSEETLFKTLFMSGLATRPEERPEASVLLEKFSEIFLRVKKGKPWDIIGLFEKISCDPMDEEMFSLSDCILAKERRRFSKEQKAGAESPLSALQAPKHFSTDGLVVGMKAAVPFCARG